jgi:peptide/nickel transport system substrate-binding protein
MRPPGSWAYDPTVERPHYDPAKAREFLKLGGKPDGFETDVITWTSDLHRPSAEIVRAQLAAVGIKVNLKIYEVTVATEKFEYGGEAPLFLTSWSRYPEPDWNASLIYKSDGYYNPGKLKDARVDALIDEGAAISDIANRKPIYRQIDEIELGEARMVPLLYGVSNATAPNNVIGLDGLFGWDAKFSFKQVSLKPA